MVAPVTPPTTAGRIAGRLALATGLLPVIAVNLAYLVAAGSDSLPMCVPYLDGCTSISSTGRVFPSVWIFKPLMVISGIVMAWFFLVAGQQTARPAARFEVLTWCGLAATLALLMYIIFLGTEGPTYRLLRRYGVSLYFGFVLLGQLLLARRLAYSGKRGAWLMLTICGILLVPGVASVVIMNFLENTDIIENIIEWNFALLLQANFLLAGRLLAESRS